VPNRRSSHPGSPIHSDTPTEAGNLWRTGCRSGCPVVSVRAPDTPRSWESRAQLSARGTLTHPVDKGVDRPQVNQPDAIRAAEPASARARTRGARDARGASSSQRSRA
jgi:hypothetical protein